MDRDFLRKAFNFSEVWMDCGFTKPEQADTCRIFNFFLKPNIFFFNLTVHTERLHMVGEIHRKSLRTKEEEK